MLARMLRLLLPVLLLGWLSPDPAAAQAAPSPASAWQLEDYRTALAGLLIEERCRGLTGDARRELAWRVGRIAESLRGHWDAPMLERVADEAAKAAAEAECGAAAEAAVARSFAVAREFNSLLPGPDFSPEALHIADTARLARLLVVQRVDDRCQALEEEQRNALDADVEVLRRRLAAETEPEMLKRLDAFADMLGAQIRRDEPALACDEFDEPALEDTLAEARRAAAW